ncbi:MAG: ribosome maturation factor RimM [Betaproteobacteria bacterium]|nr:ribosome maturation factor RimM [Betaproteobacteria bacterium]
MVVMGHIMGPFGILGWVKVNTYTEHVDRLLDYSTWWLGTENDAWQQMQVITGHINGNTLNAKLKECIDRTQASQLKGMQIAIPRDQLPALPENGESGYYWSDLIGTEVVNLANEKLGKTIGFYETGANDVLRVQQSNGNKKEILIPFIEQAVIKVDLKEARITVDWGLDY